MSGAEPWRAAPGGVSLKVRLTPKGGADRIDGIGADAEGRPVLLVRVAAPPVEGAANAALIKLIAKAAGAPKSRLSLTAGAGARIKRLHISGDAQAIADALRAAVPARRA
ncbi:DUF167 domain-containing protein [Pikeienuella piscinae]|uniref:UPF0235 protein G5B40_08570 n=1 Tax=Pikeienuella piscinae TaxID=2748098 RepID=A0A7L5BYB1_9RHOB|nr:DUF167 family protein [Pikeienuella piscinae]QIE55507.1 DUF167 domain-containing protein [Pikeienuella piscinae]